MNAVSERTVRKTKVPASVPYEPRLKRRLAADPEQASLYLRAAMEEASKANDPGIFQLALKDVAEARGGITLLARETGLNRQHLYRIMSRAGNPSFTGLWRMLRVFDLGFSVIPRARRLRGARS
jgi:probable addiction module antidote protein